MKNTSVHIGCSSYATASWQPLFYPKDLARKYWFDYYCRYFNTYELNSTFYKFPTVKSLESWYERTPEDFKFSIKAPKIITHLKRFSDSQEEIKKFYEVVQQGLKDKLGCVLFQLPPSFHYSPERLVKIIGSVNKSFNNIIEFRHESWWNEMVQEGLSDAGITFCNVSYPKLPKKILKTTSTTYIRMHGDLKIFYSEYTPGEIENIYTEVVNKNFTHAYIYFNNTASTGGIINALQAKEIFNS